MDLVLERRAQPDGTVRIGGVAMTPLINSEYWTYRVRLTDGQAVVGFPKFSTIGIGFAEEEDWNTNLPYTCGTREIYDHIEHNRGDVQIPEATCLAAIELIQRAAAEDRAD